MPLSRSVIFACSFLFCLLPTFSLWAYHPDSLALSTARFVENKGQWDEYVSYRLKAWQGDVLFAPDRFIYSLMENEYMHLTREHGHHAHHEEENHDEAYNGHIYQARFLHTSAQKQIVPLQAYPDYENYYLGNEPARWKSGVRVFGAMTYQELYTGIDMYVFGTGTNLKYEFYVQPNAKPADIQIQYEGIEKMYLQEGNLVLETAAGTVKELAPIAFQLVNGKRKNVPCQYVLQQNTLSFEFPSGYDPSADLVIDPTVVFSTYTGSTQDNWGFTATYDLAGNAYGGGIIFSQGFPIGYAVGSTGYPTLGAFQTSFRGGERDATITKFNPAGTQLIYSTYLGGLGIDQPHSMVADKIGNLYVFGRTNSTNFPIQGGYQTSNRGGVDIFVSKFSPTGQYLASTYLGGSADDAVNISASDAFQGELKFNYGDDARGEIILDDFDNVYVASCTNSNNFPTTGGSFDTSFGGQQDGIVFKLNSSLNTLIWGAYLGGSAKDAAYAVELDSQGNLFVTGGTQSSNFPVTGGVFQGTYGGNIDGFLCKISNNGNTLLKSTYVGTGSYDQTYFVQLDQYDAVYVVGQTRGTFPKSPGTYGNPGGRQFIAKIANDLSVILLSTTFGSSTASFPNISPTAFLVDVCRNIYVCGWGASNNSSFQNSSGTFGLPVTPDAYKPNTDGNDFYVMVLEKDMQGLRYGTFFGGTNAEEHVDGGTSRFDKRGIIYEAVCASCGGTATSFPATPGAWSSANQSSNCNLAVFKIALNFAGITADFQPTNNGIPLQNYEGCAPLTVNFNNTTLANSTAATTYTWNFGNGSTSNQANPSFTFTQPGTYEVSLIAYDPTTCNERDTIRRTITIWSQVVVDAGPTQYICGSPTTLTATVSQGNPSYSFQWQPTAGLTSPTSTSTLAQPATTTLYTVNITDSKGCKASDTVRVYTNVLGVNITPDTFFCVGGSVVLSAAANNANTFSWVPATGLSSPIIANPVANPSNTTIYTVYVGSTDGCNGTGVVRVEPKPLPFVSLGNDKTVCYGDTAFLQTNAPTAVSYQWSPSAGLSGNDIPDPYATILQSQTYTVQVTDAFGCKQSDNIFINVLPQIPLAIKPDTIICQGASVQLYANSPNTSLSYQWSPSTYLNNPFLQNPFAASPGNILYTLTVTDSVGCKRRDSTRITIFEVFTISDTMVCIGDSVRLLTTGGVSFAWTPAQFLSDPNTSSPWAFPPATTVYTVTAISDKGCISTKSVEVVVHPRPTAVVGEDKFMCFGDSVQLQGSGGLTYAWSPPQYANDPSLPNPMVSPPVTTPYVLTVFDAVGCTDKDTVMVTVYPLPVLSTAGDTTVCSGDTVQLSVSGAVSYAWTPNYAISDTSAPNPIVNPKYTVVYEVTGTDINGCKSSAQVPVTIRYSGVAEIAGPTAACPGVPVTLTASGGETYLWSTGDTSRTITFLLPATQWFYLTGYIDDCATTTDSIQVFLADPPVANFTFTDSLFAPATITVDNLTVGGNTYLWTWGDVLGIKNTEFEPSHVYQHAGQYPITLIAYSYRGCTDTLTKVVNIQRVTLFVPTVFTPNEDGYNDEFFVPSYGLSALTISIYNRWGQKIFESDNPDFRWDGTHKGALVPEGVYVWVVKATGKNGNPYQQEGTVTIVR